MSCALCEGEPHATVHAAGCPNAYDEDDNEGDYRDDDERSPLACPECGELGLPCPCECGERPR